MDCSSPPPLSSNCSQILNMSPRLPNSHHLNHSSAELVQEIATLEDEILRLERYLLSLYRTAFHRHVPTPSSISEQPSHVTKFAISKDYVDAQGQTSPTSALTGPDDLVKVARLIKSSSRREKKSAYIQHRSLADHLGNPRIDNALICPARLSEDIIRCISSIYCKLANPARPQKGNSVSSTSSFCSSSTFSPRNFSGSWSPQCNDDVMERYDIEGPEQIGPYAGMVQVTRLCLDDENYSYAATMLQKFRSLVKSLEIVDLKKMRREEKLAFWINIHNALMMHAYLAYGTQNFMKNSSFVKATYNVGGICVNAYDIQSVILGIKSHYSASWLQTLVSPGKRLKTKTTKHAYAIEYPEPLVHFALCSGSYSDPVVRAYKAKSIFQDLKVAKEEFIQATVYIHKQTKIYLPKILRYYAKDMSLGMATLLEVVSGCSTRNQRMYIRKFVEGQPEKYVYWLEQSCCFRYLIDNNEISERR